MKKCPYCAENIQYEAVVCRYCGRDLHVQKSPVNNKRIYTSLVIIVIGIFIIVAVTWILFGGRLSAFGGPPDEYLISTTLTEDIFDNIEIVNKVKCQSLSSQAKALGIDEAWLVAFSYDVLDDNGAVWRHEPGLIHLYVYIDGKWLSGFTDLGITSEDCP